jgi:hypothetical protein
MGNTAACGPVINKFSPRLVLGPGGAGSVARGDEKAYYLPGENCRGGPGAFMKSNLIYYLLGFVLVVIVLLLVGPHFSHGTPAGLVDEIAGKAEVKPGEKSAWRPLKLGEALAPGTSLKVGPGGRVSLRWPAGSRLYLGADSEITLTGSFEDNTDKTFNLELKQQAGKLWVRLRKESTITVKITLTTPVAVITAGHSTLFSSELLGEGKNRLEVPEGKIELAQGEAKSIVSYPKLVILDRSKGGEAPRAMTEEERSAWGKLSEITGAFITLNQPREGEKLSSALLSLSGYTDPGNAVDIVAANRGAMNQTSASVDPKTGIWHAKIALSRGETELRINVLDEEGRHTLILRKVSY